MCMCNCKYLQRPKNNCRYLRRGVTGNCKAPFTSAEYGTLVLWKQTNPLNVRSCLQAKHGRFSQLNTVKD